MVKRAEVTVEEIARLRWLADLEPLDGEQALYYELFNEEEADDEDWEDEG